MPSYNQIKEISDQHGLNQSDIARITGYSPAHVSKWKSGERKIPENVIEKLKNWIKMEASKPKISLEEELDKEYSYEDIEKIMTKYKLNQKQISKITGFGETAIYKWKTGQNPVHKRAILLLTRWVEKFGTDYPSGSAIIWAIINHKGGVGKTTACFNLGLEAALSGKKVLLIDIDTTSNLTSSLVIKYDDITAFAANFYSVAKNKEPIIPMEISENLYLIAADKALGSVASQGDPTELVFLLKEGLEKIKSDYDIIIIDSPPSSDSPLYKGAILAADLVILPFTPDQYDTGGIYDICDEMHKHHYRGLNEKSKIAALVANNIPRPTRTYDKYILDSVRQQYIDSKDTNNVFHQQFDVFEISQSIKVKECKSAFIREPITKYAPKSRVAGEYRKLFKHMISISGLDNKALRIVAKSKSTVSSSKRSAS